MSELLLQKRTPTLNIDVFIIALMFLILPIDSVNGLMLKKFQIFLPLSVSQVFKLILIVVLLCRLLINPKSEIFIVSGLFLLFCIPPSIQFIINEEHTFKIFIDDIIQTSKYFTPLLAFVYFKELLIRRREYIWRLIKRWLYFSYVFFVINILLKYVGLGFPMYDHGDIGSTGFFYAGNEISILLLLLYSFIAYQLWEIKQRKTWYFIFFIFTLFVALTISSKTALLGVVLFTVFIPFKLRNLMFISPKKAIKVLLSVVVLIPALVYAVYTFILNSSLSNRLYYFYKKWDLLTFILSGRNFRVEEMYDVFMDKFNIWEKLIGGGQYFYESKITHVIEIDLLDIIAGYGILGGLIFIIIILLLFVMAYNRMWLKNYIYGKLSFINVLIIIFISQTAGHVLNSGIAGFYIGIILALMFFKKKENIQLA